MQVAASAVTMRDQRPRCVRIDAWGEELSRRQGAIDVELGDWLLAVREERVDRRLGFGSMFEYVEKRMGLDGHSVAERVRVAEVLRGLPATTEALRCGRRSWSAVRELTRVAVPETEREWLEATGGLRVREVEKMVSGRRPGQRPNDPTDPRAERHVLRLEVPAETYALFREAVRVLRRDVDSRLGEEEVLAEMARRVLGGPKDEGRAPYQVALVRCEDCGRAWQQARGEQVEVPAEVAERAGCDGQHIGAVDEAQSSPVGRSGRRASQTIPPATRRFVMRGDRGRCRVPGCSSSTWLEVHHLRLRSDGGDHDPDQLAVLCGSHG